jgi:hypothetical protein
MPLTCNGSSIKIVNRLGDAAETLSPDARESMSRDVGPRLRRSEPCGRDVTQTDRSLRKLHLPRKVAEALRWMRACQLARSAGCGGTPTNKGSRPQRRVSAHSACKPIRRAASGRQMSDPSTTIEHTSE